MHIAWENAHHYHANTCYVQQQHGNLSLSSKSHTTSQPKGKSEYTQGECVECGSHQVSIRSNGIIAHRMILWIILGSKNVQGHDSHEEVNNAPDGNKPKPCSTPGLEHSWRKISFTLTWSPDHKTPLE